MDSDSIWIVAFLVGIVGAGLVILIIWAVASSARTKKQAGILMSQARAYMDDVQRRRALPQVGTTIMLKPGENAFYYESCQLYETRAVRHFESGHAGFRIAKGVYVGGTKGRSTSTQEWTQIDSGRLTITSKRLVFDGGRENRTVPLQKIIGVENNNSAMEVSVEGRQKSMIFTSSNPLILSAVIRICCQVEDPNDLSKTQLNVVYSQ
jgi:hypothetical protein